jgi:hypothetical protein
MVLTSRCTVTPMIHGGFEQPTGSDHRKHTGPITTKEMQPTDHTKGMNGMLQPPDIVINRPFKAHIRRSYSEQAQRTQGNADSSPQNGHTYKCSSGFSKPGLFHMI